MLSTVLILVGVILLLAVILNVSDNLLQIEAKKSGIDITKEDVGIIPKLSFDKVTRAPASITKGSYHNLKRGFDLNLAGEASDYSLTRSTNRYSVRPGDFRGIAPIPKVELEVGGEVLAGDPIFYDKTNPDIKYVAPVSGELVEVRRGAKRAITDVIILADKKMQYKSHTAPSLNASPEEITKFLMGAGAWPLINKRPFDVVPDPQVTPRDIFISTFNSGPLAADMDVLMEGKKKDFQAGVTALSKLTSGNVHLGLKAGNAGWFDEISDAELHYFNGKHPAGNVGIQIHHIAPINGGDTVWTLTAQGVASIGSLFTKGHLDMSRKVAIAGADLGATGYVNTYSGANIGELLSGESTEGQRIVAGDVLTGRKATTDEFMSLDGSLITVLKEGNEHEFMGWLLPITPRPSASGTFPNFLFPNHKFEANTNTHGERRAFVSTGEYEKVLPMDIFPQHLLKAILANDYERMEGLGINELSEEDVALCEFVCSSKQPVQKILRQGLEMMREQA